MEGRNQQLSRMRDRLRMLLSTHLSALNHTTLKPAIGEVVIQQDTPAERILVVQAGELRVERTESGGRPQLIATIGPDEMVGEMALIGDQRHSASVTVSRGPAELLAVQADDLLQAAIYDSDLVMELLALSSHRCRQTNHHLALILEGLEALSTRDKPLLERCCKELDKSTEQALCSTAEQLRRLERTLDQS
ncbi:Cyclic nucleotide-binding domain protein [Synechococcus sp. MIT S9508]|nr:Cyclic nucleotide-binding domain protein [Synechococcus sp. MIT S9508]